MTELIGIGFITVLIIVVVILGSYLGKADRCE